MQLSTVLYGLYHGAVAMLIGLSVVHFIGKKPYTTITANSHIFSIIIGSILASVSYANILSTSTSLPSNNIAAIVTVFYLPSFAFGIMIGQEIFKYIFKYRNGK